MELELRQSEGSTMEADEGGSVIRGLAIPFNSESGDLGGFTERVAPDVIVDYHMDDVFALFAHDWDRVLGRVSAGTLSLERREDGIHSVIELPDTSDGVNLGISVARGDIRSQSFGFQVKQEAWTEDNDRTLRTLNHIVLAEVSPVALPAYGATDVGVAQRALAQFRSKAQAQKQRRLRELVLYN